MAEKIIMPKAGMAMEEGKIIKWLVREGDTVEKGAPLLEIETDKVSMEIEATVSGTLLKILANEGDTVPVIQTIGYIGTPGETIIETEKKTAEKQPEIKKTVVSEQSGIKLARADKIPATPLAKTLAKQRNISLDGVAPSGYYGEVKARDVAAAQSAKATPLAKKIARDAGVSLGDVKVDGRIYSKDIQAIIDAARGRQEDAAPTNGWRHYQAAFRHEKDDRVTYVPKPYRDSTGYDGHQSGCYRIAGRQKTCQCGRRPEDIDQRLRGAGVCAGAGRDAGSQHQFCW